MKLTSIFPRFGGRLGGSLALPFLFFAVSTAGGGPANRQALFAGGCFWCMEPPFDRTPGVVSTTAGYCGGPEKNPKYEDVARGRTGHRETIQVTYDPERVSYRELLEVFLRNINPTQADGQFADRGTQYAPAVFHASPEEKAAAEEAIQALAASGKFNQPITVKVLPATEFYPAEEYHQDFYRKNPAHYKSYSVGSGRAGFLERTWGSDK